MRYFFTLFTHIKVLYLCLLFFPMEKIFCFSFPYERMEIVKTLTKKYKTLQITQYVRLKNPYNKIFLPYYWKVYYQKNKIVGEELYKNGILSYFYIYFYTPNKIYQKGFFWYGIYTGITQFKTHNKYLKQGFSYKYIPDSYRVFKTPSLKLTYEYYFTNKEI